MAVGQTEIPRAAVYNPRYTTPNSDKIILDK
jgi:hypothetical protein